MRKRSVRSIILILVIVVLAMVGAYFAGLTQGRSDLSAQKANFERQLSDLQRSMALSESRNALSKAQLSLCRTSFDLDQKNFGLANTHIREAAAALSLVSPVLIGTDPGRFEEIRRRLSAINLEVSSNTEKEKVEIQNILAELEALAKSPLKAEVRTPPAPSQSPS